MSYWLRPHIKVLWQILVLPFLFMQFLTGSHVVLQCYPKFGDVVFTLTRFFRDKDFCDLKPKLAKSCTKGITQLNPYLAINYLFLLIHT